MRFRPLTLVLVLAAALLPAAALASSLSVDSSAFLNGGEIPTLDSGSVDGCIGRNISPPLRITGVPAGARSLAVVVFDIDAGNGAGYVHWVAYDIAPGVGSLPPGFGTTGTYVGGKNDAGTLRYAGPCPPPGDPPHHYQFSIYALSLAPGHLPAGLTRAAFLRAIAAHTLAVGTLTGTFAR
jgi:Raf kinase inhibitor-like YbhB/YbcL family protein